MTQASSEVQAIAETAAKWWADKLRQPRVKSDYLGNTGSDIEIRQSVMLDLLRNSARPQYAIEGIARFEQHLAETISIALLASSRLNLHVDYDPCNELVGALKYAEFPITGNEFPYKTSMYITADPPSVSVSEGYRAPAVELFARQEDSP